MKRPLLSLLLALVATGCGFIPAADAPKVVAHRAAAGNWPENSRTAVRGAIAANYPGIEFDVVLTSDLVPVLSHDAWLDEHLCTRADGTALPEGERLLIKDITLADLQAGFVCGGVPDPEQPDAEVVAETLMTLDEFLDEVSVDPDMILHFDMKYDADLTPPADDFIREVYGRMTARGLPNPWYTSSSELDFIPLAVAAVPEGVGVTLTWPKFPAGESTTLVALSNEAIAQLGLGDPLAIARRTGATGLLMQYRVVDRRIVEAAKQLGLDVQLWTLNAENVLDAYCQWPVDVLVTDYPERASCL